MMLNNTEIWWCEMVDAIFGSVNENFVSISFSVDDEDYVLLKVKLSSHSKREDDLIENIDTYFAAVCGLSGPTWDIIVTTDPDDVPFEHEVFRVFHH